MDINKIIQKKILNEYDLSVFEFLYKHQLHPKLFRFLCQAIKSRCECVFSDLI